MKIRQKLVLDIDPKNVLVRIQPLNYDHWNIAATKYVYGIHQLEYTCEKYGRWNIANTNYDQC